MNLYKTFVFIYILVYSIASSAQTATVNGVANSFNNDKVYLSKVVGRLINVDSSTISGGKFSFAVQVSQDDLYRIRIPKARIDKSICLEPGSDISVAIKGAADISIIVNKGMNQQLLNGYSDAVAPLDSQIITFEQEVKMAMQQKDPKTAAATQNKIFSILKQKDQLILKYIKQYPNTFAAVVLADKLTLQEYKGLNEVYNKLDTVSYAYSQPFKSFKGKYYALASAWLEGKVATDFKASDISGKEFSLSDFRGSYVLLDFWASWCKPCIEKTKKLVKIYDDLKKRGIVVVSFSFDTKEEKWKEASSVNGIKWVNLSDLKGVKSPLAADYKVSQIPKLFLIDPHGKIVSQDPDIENLPLGK